MEELNEKLKRLLKVEKKQQAVNEEVERIKSDVNELMTKNKLPIEQRIEIWSKYKGLLNQELIGDLINDGD